MFSRNLSIVILGDGHRLSLQTRGLANRWAEFRLIDLNNSTFIDYASFLKADLILICISSTDNIEMDTREVADLVTQLELANEGRPVNNIVVRTRVSPGSAKRLGLHVFNDYNNQQLLNQTEHWVLGVNADSEPDRIRDNIEQLIQSAFQSGLLNVRPDLEIVSAAEAEAIWFTRAALIACEKQFLLETRECLQRHRLNADIVIDKVLMTFPDTLQNLFPSGDITEWLDEISTETNVPLLRILQ